MREKKAKICKYALKKLPKFAKYIYARKCQNVLIYASKKSEKQALGEEN